MALVYIDDDPWLKELENCQTLCSDLAYRVECFLSGNLASAGQAADIRIRLRQCDQQVAQLRSALFMEDPLRHITVEEHERRERLLETLMDKAKHIRAQFTSPQPAAARVTDKNRDILFANSTSATAGRANASIVEIDNSRKTQADIIAEQDKGLEALSAIISRQKNIAQSIDSEVTTQNDLVTTLAENISQTAVRTEGATRRTATLDLSDNTCGYWVVAILLFIAIIAVAII